MKLFRWVFLTVVGLALGVGFSFMPVVASAEEPPQQEIVVEEEVYENAGTEDITEDIIPETETSKWFETYIIPVIINVLAPLGGTIAGGVVVFKGISNAKAILDVAIKGLSNAKGQTDDASKDLTDARAEMKEWQISQSKEIGMFMEGISNANEAWKKQFTQMVMEMFEKLQEDMCNTVSDTNTTVHKLLDVEKIAYGDNPVLVSNGTAKKIADYNAKNP